MRLEFRRQILLLYITFDVSDRRTKDKIMSSLSMAVHQELYSRIRSL